MTKVKNNMQFAPSRNENPDPPLMWLERERKIPIDVASKFGVTTHNGHLAFEFYRGGTLRYVKWRITTPDGGKSFRRDKTDEPSCMFNEDCLNEKCGPSDVLIFTEGEIDCLSFLTIGCPFVVSVPDGGQLNKPGEGDIDPKNDNAFKWLWDGSKLRPEIAKFSNYLIATDDDEKGQILRDELAVRLGRGKCWHIRFPEGCKDANEVLMKYGEETLIEAYSARQPMVPNRLVPFSAIPKQGYRDSYRTGWIGLDKHLKIVPPELMVVTGAPGSGKSQWTLALVANLARIHGLKGAVLQFEDNIERNRTDLTIYAKSMVDEVQGRDDLASAWIDRNFRTISPSEDNDPNVDYTLAWLQDAIEEAATRHNCKWVLIDPWNEIEHIWSKNETESKYTNDALRMLKRLARRFQIAVIIVTHPGKEGGKQKDITELSLYDISGSAAWKNKADHGIIIHRDYTGDKLTWVKIDKSKNHMVMGIPGIVTMRYLPKSATYELPASHQTSSRDPE